MDVTITLTRDQARRLQRLLFGAAAALGTEAIEDGGSVWVECVAAWQLHDLVAKANDPTFVM